MDEKTNEALVGVAAQITEWLKSAGDLVTQEAPLLAQEVVRYGIFNAAYGLIFGVLMAVLCTFLIRYTLKELQKEASCDDSIIVAIVGVIITGLLSFCLILVNISQLGKALIAPRLYLLEQMAKLVN